MPGKLDGVNPENNEEDNGSDAPIFDKFYGEGGAGAILEMKNFSPPQFVGIWVRLQDLISERVIKPERAANEHTLPKMYFL